MGIFNEIMVPCPKCGTRIEFQTKSSPELCLARIMSENATLEDVLGISGKTEECPNCKTEVTVRVQVAWQLLAKEAYGYSKIENIVGSGVKYE